MVKTALCGGPDPPLLAIEKVSFGYTGNPTLLRDLDLVLQPGGRIRIRGASGTGKTPLLRLRAGLELPVAGAIRFEGADLMDIPPPVYRSSVVYLQQIPAVLDLSIRENLMLPFTFAAHRERTPPDEQGLQRSVEALFPEGIRLDQPARELSVGQQQRLCFARALLLEPRVLLLDEPVSALDRDSADLVMTAALEANRSRKTALVLNTHTEGEGGFSPHGSLVILDGGLQERERV